jgi:hypothetical protein
MNARAFPTIAAGIKEDSFFVTKQDIAPEVEAPQLHQLLFEWNNTASNFPSTAYIHELLRSRLRGPTLVAQ